MLDEKSFYFRELNSKEFHVFYKETRIFIMKQKVIQGESYWTCKSCLSYVPSMKEETFEKAKERIIRMVHEFLERFK